ncbi:MAG: alpha-glucan family phosphorylase [Deltaproteobacteria bacterium]|nr:alpha-glucan family phosphorylase [Deltaproteobacteria bacterium]
MNTVAYFSMEIGLRSEMPTYCGGLGVLAGDTLRAAADLGIPMLGVTLLHRKGYFKQSFDAQGNQVKKPYEWNPENFLEQLPVKATLSLQDRSITLCCWRFLIQGVSGHSIPVYLLDTQLAENNAFDQTLTDHLYGEDDYYRLCQEAVLGLGGIAMLRLLSDKRSYSYHMNEGHSALLTLALLEEKILERKTGQLSDEDKEAVRQQCVFTTHTPVPAGHDQFPLEMVEKVLGKEHSSKISETHCCLNRTLNMTYLALYFSRYINGVALRHGEISRGLFPQYPINSITNGIHSGTWISKAFAQLFDARIPEWRHDNIYLRHAIDIPLRDIEQAHQDSKDLLFTEIEKRSSVHLNPRIFTIGFARRATAYKRADLLFTDLERLKRIAIHIGPFQILYAGKAHPHDEGGKALIRKIFKIKEDLKQIIPILYLEDYDMALAQKLCAGVDLWLNTPQKPHEASGTSGMKAALNGVPSLSVLDGWWIEGHVEGVTGWSIGESSEPENDAVKESDFLYDKLEQKILPLFYGHPQAYARVMRSAIALNASFFNTQRMVMQYMRNAYRLDDH